MLNDNDNWDDNVVQCSCCVDDEGVDNRTHGADDDGGNDGDDEGEEDVQDGDYDGEEDNDDGDDDGDDGDDEGDDNGDYDASRNVILTPSTRRLYPPRGPALD